MYNKTNIIFSLIIMLCVSCDDEDTITTPVMTNSGNEIAMDGIWNSDCIDFTEFRLKESFDFDGENLVITINQYSGETCENPDQIETVTITFQTAGTLEAMLNGSTVIGNKVSGTQQSSSNANKSAFKQTFYVDDASGKSILYHGIFADDGGAVSSDGYPIELHPFAIVRE